MLLVPFLKELWMFVFIAVVIWPIGPLLATFLGYPRGAVVVNILTALVLAYIAYRAFQVSLRPRHVNQAGEILPSFTWLFATCGACVAVCWAVSIETVLRRVKQNLGTEEVK